MFPNRLSPQNVNDKILMRSMSNAMRKNTPKPVIIFTYVGIPACSFIVIANLERYTLSQSHFLNGASGLFAMSYLQLVSLISLNV